MDSLEEVLAIGAVAVAFVIIFSLVLIVLQIVANWKIFSKAGEPGWKSIIPIYNEYTRYKFSYTTKAFWTMIISSFIMGFFEGIAANSSTAIALICYLIVIASAVVTIVINIKSYVNLAKSFGKSDGFAVGLIFLPVIFLLILGLGDAKYIGNKSTK